MRISVKIPRKLALAASVAVVALAICVGGATAYAREPVITPSSAAAMPFDNGPGVDRNWYAQNDIKLYRVAQGTPVYPEAHREIVPGILVDSDGVTCNSKMATIVVTKNGSFTFNGKLVTTELASNGVGITTYANRPLTIIVFTSNGIKVAQVPASSENKHKFVLRNEDWTGDPKFILRNGVWVEDRNFPPTTFCG